MAGQAGHQRLGLPNTDPGDPISHCAVLSEAALRLPTPADADAMLSTNEGMLAALLDARSIALGPIAPKSVSRHQSKMLPDLCCALFIYLQLALL